MFPFGQVVVPVIAGEGRAPINEEQILAAYQLFNTPHEFTDGDRVMWKPGMKDRRFPCYGEAAIVMDTYPGGLRRCEYPEDTPKHDPMSGTYADCNDILVGCFTDEGVFVQWWMDSRRFMLYEINEARSIRKAMELEAQRKRESIEAAGQNTIRSIMDGLMDQQGDD